MKGFAFTPLPDFGPRVKPRILANFRRIMARPWLVCLTCIAMLYSPYLIAMEADNMSMDYKTIKWAAIDIVLEAAGLNREYNDLLDAIPGLVDFALQYDARILPLDESEVTIYPETVKGEVFYTYDLNLNYWRRIGRENGGYQILYVTPVPAPERAKIQLPKGGKLGDDDLATRCKIVPNSQLGLLETLGMPYLDALPWHTGIMLAEEIAAMPRLKNYQTADKVAQRAEKKALKATFTPSPAPDAGLMRVAALLQSVKPGQLTAAGGTQPRKRLLAAANGDTPRAEQPANLEETNAWLIG